MINAIQINSTQPFFARNPNGRYTIKDYELLSTILSALFWRKNNGKMTMYTTKEAYDYYNNLGIIDIWDKVDTETLTNFDENIDFAEYWAAGKILAVRKEKAPFVMIDTDLIFWENVEALIKGKEDKTICIHKEGLSVYRGRETLKLKEDYEFDPEWDWSIDACNTAFVYFGDEELRQYYVKEFFRYIDGNPGSHYQDSNSQIVFAEQRLLAMCGKKLGREPESFSTFEELMMADRRKQNSKFTHVWGFKKEMDKELPQQAKFCMSCLRTIEIEFPEYKDAIFKIPEFQVYLNLIEILKNKRAY